MVIILVILAAVTISSVYKSKVVDYAINGAINYSTEGVNENKVIEETANVIESAVNNITGVGGTGTLPNPSPDPGGSTTPEDKTPPIVNVTKGEVTTNSIQVSVTATDVGSGLPAIPKYTYYIRKSGETTYRKVVDKVRENTYTYRGLEQGVQYDVKVEVADMAGNIGAGSIKMITTGRIPGGETEGILGFGAVTWNNGKAKTLITTNNKDYFIQYKVGQNGEWNTGANKGESIETAEVVSGTIIYARLWDGQNGGEEKELEIKDITAPEITITTANIVNSVSFTARDEESGIVAYKVTKEVTEPGEGWLGVTNTKNLAETTVNNLESNSTYYIWIKDAAGNTSSKTFGTMGQFTVTYNYTENGGTAGTVTTKQVVEGQKVDLTPTATKAGWNFAGWNTNKDAEAGLTEYTMPANNVTLYAIFSKDITVTYKTYNNQTKTETVKLSNNQTTGEVTLPSIANVTDSGVTYTMRGWSTQDTANASTTAAGTKVTITGNTTYYASYQTTINTTFYYNSNTTSGSLTVAQEIVKATRQMNYTGTKIEGSINIPTVVTGSVGKYNSSYKGVATAVNTTATTNTLTVGGTYYAVYSTPVTIYYPTSKTVATNMTKHRNEYFTSTSAMSVKLGDNNAVTTDFNFTSSVEGYSLYGFANVENTATRTDSSISGLAGSNVTTAYAILYKASGTNTYYTYCINTTTAKCTEPLSSSDLGTTGMIGKYVNYVPAGSNYTVDGIYSGTESNQTFSANNSMKWRIWGVEGNKLLLISETLAGSIKLSDTNGYNNAVKILNDACEQAFGNSITYGIGAIKARSINQEDIDKVTNMTTDEQRKAVNSYYGTTMTPSYNNYYPKIYEQEPSKSGGGTLARSAQSSWYSGKVSGSSKGKYTYYNYSITSKAINTMYDALLTNPVANSTTETDNHSSYWVASRCVQINTNAVAYFRAFVVSGGEVAYCSLDCSNDSGWAHTFAVRPMIEVDLNLLDVGKTGDGTIDNPYSLDTTGIGMQVGEYVDYKPAGSNYTVSGTYSGTGSNQTFSANNSMKWRIWGVQGNKLLLISETLAGSIKLSDTNGYNNAVKLLNDACSTAFGNSNTYGSGAVVARSINQEDIDKVTNMSTDEQRKAVNSYYGTTMTPSFNDCYPSIYLQEASKSGGGTLARSAQSSWYSGNISGSSKGKYTYYNYSITTKATNAIYDALLTNPTASSVIETDNHSSYWVASRCVQINTNAVAYYRTFIVSGGNISYCSLDCSTGSGWAHTYAVRPVVEVNLDSVAIGSSGSGTASSPYSMAKK